MMQYVKILINENEGGEPCLAYLPDRCKSPQVNAEVLQCTATQDGGCAMIRIFDPERVIGDVDIEEKVTFPDGSMSTVDRITSQQFIAMVRNRTCKLSKIISQSGCFVTSAVREDKDICWTIVGMDSKNITSMMKSLVDNGFNVRRKSTFNTDLDTSLSNRQESAIRTAVECGYYNIPRRIKLADLARKLGCSKSTLDFTLRAAERKIITHYIVNNRELLSVKR